MTSRLGEILTVKFDDDTIDVPGELLFIFNHEIICFSPEYENISSFYCPNQSMNYLLMLKILDSQASMTKKCEICCSNPHLLVIEISQKIATATFGEYFQNLKHKHTFLQGHIDRIAGDIDDYSCDILHEF